jgi:hypothetical protein
VKCARPPCLRNSRQRSLVSCCCREAGGRAFHCRLGHDGDEDKAVLHPRFRREIRTLVGCPEASRTEAIKGIIMQRFFGDTRRFIRRYDGPTGTPISTQPTIDVVGKVLDTPELLESILSHLPVRTLVTATRVSRTFRNVIHDSPELLKILFLLPQREPSETMTGATSKELDSDEFHMPSDDYRAATLCPLLNIHGQHLTPNKRLISTGCETAIIKSPTAWADSFTHMYLTNPPCTKVEVEFVYTGGPPATEPNT